MQLPVVTTLMGKGAFPEDHHLCIGMPGMHGAKYTNYAITETDLLIAVGVRFDDRVTGKLVDVREQGEDHPRRRRPGRDRQEQAGRRADRGRRQARPRRHRRRAAQDRRRAAAPRRGCASIDDWRKQFPLHYDRERGRASCPQYVVQRDRASSPRTARRVICTEVGQNQMWACQYYTLRDAAHAGSPPAGSARWASASRRPSARRRAGPTHLVIDIAGDGSIQMNSQELATAQDQRAARSRSSSSTTATSAWCASGRSSSTASATRRRVLAAGLPRLREARRGVRLARRARHRRPTSSTRRSRRRSTTTARRSWTAASSARSACSRWSPRAARIDEMLGGVPGCPVSEMLDDELLEEVWE